MTDKAIDRRSGFTLTEVVLVVAIFSIVLATAVSLVSTRTSEEDLEFKSQEVADIIAKAQNFSLSGFQGDVWGIKVLDSSSDCPSSGDCIVMFKGWPYSARDSSYDQFVDLSNNTGVYVDSDQANEFYFDYHSGWLATSTGALAEQVIVLKSNFGEQKSIIVHPTGIVSVFTCGQSKVYDSEGNSYQTVAIGSQCWLAQNLNIGSMLSGASTDPTDNGIIEKWCEDDTASNCDDQGGLYHWDELMAYSETEGAQGICPAGWHVPSDSELDTLEANYSPATDGMELKIGGSSGFDLLESNRMNTDTDSYDDADLSGLWTSTISGSDAYVHYTDSVSDEMSEATHSQGYGYSLRCLKDD